ncbi:YraN family protein [Eikenella halliae]|uniref:YraN family protein n=1 Tax=Eikenella halliae TaxID=1795832 RepID=UPI0028D44DB7|nr:YraN family protein [Eikenella halliae]
MRLNHAAGQAAEDTAAGYLKKQGCRILARNWHCRYGEIDIIAEQGGVYLFVEVRQRRSQSFGGAAASITPVKLAKLSRSAETWLQQNAPNQPCRIDAVLIEGDRPPQWLKDIGGY